MEKSSAQMNHGRQLQTDDGNKTPMNVPASYFHSRLTRFSTSHTSQTHTHNIFLCLCSVRSRVGTYTKQKYYKNASFHRMQQFPCALQDTVAWFASDAIPSIYFCFLFLVCWIDFRDSVLQGVVHSNKYTTIASNIEPLFLFLCVSLLLLFIIKMQIVFFFASSLLCWKLWQMDIDDFRFFASPPELSRAQQATEQAGGLAGAATAKQCVRKHCEDEEQNK